MSLPLSNVARIVACATGGACALFLTARLIHSAVLKTGSLHKATMKKHQPQEREITCLAGDSSTPLVYHQLFVDDAYMQHGISLVPTASSSSIASATSSASPTAPVVVVDVGANIGLFSLQVALRCPNARIIAVEPVPVLCEAIRQNTAAFRERVDIHNVALSSEASTTTTILFNPTMSAGSSLFAADIVKPGSAFSVFDWLLAFLRDAATIGQLPTLPTRWLCWLLECRYTRHVALVTIAAPLLGLVGLWLLAAPPATSRPVSIPCRLTTLSDVLQQSTAFATNSSGQRVGDVALLKIDVEGAEWAVVQGISDHDWARIQQVVIEVHDIDGRLETMCRLLKAKGFAHVVVDGHEELEVHKLFGVYLIFARK